MSKEFDLNQGVKTGEYSKLKIIWHTPKLQSLLDGKTTAPISVRVKPTNKCNHNCFYCVYNPSFSGIHECINRADEIPQRKMEEILEDFGEIGVKAVTYSGGGEPLFYEHIVPTLRGTVEKGIDLSIITNGQLLTGEAAEILRQAQWVRVSMDYCDEDTFVKSRRKPIEMFRRVIQNIKEFARAKQPGCSLGVNFVVHEHNYDKICDSARLARDIGVEIIRFAPLWCQNFEAYHAAFKERAVEAIAAARSKLSAACFKVGDSYQRDFEFSGTQQRKYSRCYYMQICPVIGADCVVYFCHNKAYDSNGALGSIRDKPFRDLWFSREAAKRFREFNPQEGCPHQCSNDEKNVLYHEMLACADPKVVNFP